jgi:hypothetical protein
MRRSITALLVALVALGGLVVPAHAGSISGTLEGDSTLTPTGPPGIFLQNFTGDGDDTTFGPFTPQSQSTIDFSNPPNILISNGTFLETFPFGTLFGTSSGSGTASGMGTATVTIDLVFTGGTGVFTGASGEVIFTGTITSTGATTASIDGTYVGTLFGVPEPGTLALLAQAVALGAVVLVRQRRRQAMAR